MHDIPLDHQEAIDLLNAYPTTLTVAQAQEALGLSESTVRRRVASGELRALRTRAGRGGRLRFLKSDVAALLVAMST